ncbi:MAG: hypothetical protein RIQ53_938 [Pseudomonadota bacterium]|jgi:osmotically-inducible protein OsmY
MKTDIQLQRDVTHELQWEPSVEAAHVGVAAQAGVVTLTGHVATFAEKHAIERAVQRVEGVKAIAVDLDVRLAPGHQRDDLDIAQAAESAFMWNVMIPDNRIQVKVEKGWVSLAGELDWEYQRRAAEKTVRALTGVTGVSNGLTLKPSVTPSNISQRIREALTRHAEREARHIDVTVSGATVTLHGRVGTLADWSAAQGAAWAAPGVNQVVNDLAVDTHA